MTKKEKTILFIFGSIGLYMLLKPSWIAVLKKFIPSVEGFSATPFWDYSQYTWGYGTKAPGPTGTITKDQAIADMLNELQYDYAYLKNYITRPLNANQWAALLSFAYNLGPADADNLAANINSGNDQALETQWKKYIYAGGVVNDGLIDRRNKEWQLWNS